MIEENYINLELMDNYLTTLHDKILPNCLCKESEQKCIDARKQNVLARQQIQKKARQHKDKLYRRRIRRNKK